MKRLCTAAVLCLALAAVAAAAGNAPTYSKEVALILNGRCVTCHRPGEIAPMSFTNYKQVRPFAKAIREAVVERKMPPWHADPHVGKFANDRRLSDEQVRTIVAWVNAGAPEGNPKDMPPPANFVEGWNMGKPDAEITIPRPFDVPAEGTVEYKYLISPTNFTEDKWVSGAEVRPGNREVVHHVIAFVLPPEGEKPQARERLGASCAQARPDEEAIKRYAERQKQGREPREQGVHLVGWAPGLQGYVSPPGTARLIRAGSRIMFQLHYTPNGKAAVDRDTRIGLIFAKGPVTRTVQTMPIMNQRIVIPPGDPNYEAASCFTFSRDVTLLDFMPHMHYRGKDFTYKLTLPDGRTETLLSVPKYDFNWQTSYKLAQPLHLPKDSRIDCTAHFDNSARNKYNPDPSKEVRWGDQTWEEMLIGWVTVAIDAAPLPAPAASASN